MPYLVCPECGDMVTWDGGPGDFRCAHCGHVVMVPKFHTVITSMSNGMSQDGYGASAIATPNEPKTKKE